ncbi:MAG: class I SAM-dependent methyltransferase [Cyclobacteriaceae bacterium]
MEKNAKEIIDALSTGPVKQFILDHENDDVRDLILKHKDILGIPIARVMEQIATRRKAREKLPLYYNTPEIIFSPPANFEQSSSELTAQYKSEIINSSFTTEKAIIADLTGGFGVDAYFFSKTAQKVHFVEPDTSLLEIARHNHQLLGARNIQYHNSTAENFIRATGEYFDFAYLDPSRRTAAKKKVHAFEDSQPDVLKLTSEIFEKTCVMMVKASPLLDIQAGMSQLTCVKNVFVVSVYNECKEILFLCEEDFAGIAAIEAVNILGDLVVQKFEFSFQEERRQMVEYSDPLKYLYEPNASILKAGAFKSVAIRFNLKKIQSSTHLYTGDHLIESFPGKRFLIEKSIRPDPSEIKKYYPDGKANVTTRNYPLSPEALKKKTGLKDGGEKFLIGFSGQKKKYLVVAKKL